MKKLTIHAALLLLASVATTPAQAAFVVGGENGWQLSTDGIVDVFSTYQSATPVPSGSRFTSFLNGGGETYQNFGVQVGLLPSVIAFNIKAPTTKGVDSAVRVGIYPSIQNKSPQGNGNIRFNVHPNIDFREFFYTAKGKYGELLAGRALNLYQGKNILTDMTLLTAGVVPTPGTATTLGHIGYGYLYTNFGPQLRYTTPDLNGIKVALSVNEPYQISADTAKTNSPRIETEISYVNANLQAWASGLYQQATRSSTAAARPGEKNHSLGGAAGISTGIGGLELLASGYVGEGLGMISAQDGDAFGSSSTDAAGKERIHYGFLTQATYKLAPDVKLGLNYGQNRQNESSDDKSRRGVGFVPMAKQEALAAIAVYNFNAFTQFVLDYTYAQNTWHDHATQHSNSIALGTMFYW
jgi:hypothetical protein